MKLPLPQRDAEMTMTMAAGICQASHLVSLMAKGVPLEEAHAHVNALVPETAMLIESGITLIDDKHLATIEMFRDVLIKACRRSLEIMLTENPPMPVGYEEPEGYHRHECGNAKCMHVWEHEDYGVGAPAKPTGQNEKDHRCPKCGTKAAETWIGYAIYKGPRAPHTTTRK
jgi:hypothetical protein